MSSNISAVVLTIGESTFDECIDRLQNQTLPIDDIIIVKDNFVLHEAYNQGIKQVKTEFFLQCDADMLIDPDCVEVLYSAIEKDTGVSIGYLDDDILGTVQAIKLFRTSCLQEQPFEDGVTTDTNAISRIRNQGLKIAFARRNEKRFGHDIDVLARHCPNYLNHTYTFGRFMRLGAQVRSRYCFDEYRACLKNLKQSKHPMADVALTAFCHGLFDTAQTGDQTYFDFTVETQQSEFLKNFQDSENNSERIFSVTKIDDLDMTAELEKFHSR